MKVFATIGAVIAAALAMAVLGTARGADAAATQKPRPFCLGKRATIVGTPKANVITGTMRNDVIVGLGGNDTITAVGGDDLVCGGPGNDTIVGGPGTDRLAGGPGRDTCRAGERLNGCEETRLAVPTGPLAPGTYVTAAFTPRFGFTVGAGWSAPFGEEPRNIILTRRRDPGGLSVTFDSFGRGQTVAATIARLAGTQGVEVLGRGAATVAGASGEQIDLRVTADDIVVVPGLADRYELEPNDRLRVYALDLRGLTLAVLVESPAAEWESFLPSAVALLDSVRWG